MYSTVQWKRICLHPHRSLVSNERILWQRETSASKVKVFRAQLENLWRFEDCVHPSRTARRIHEVSLLYLFAGLPWKKNHWMKQDWPKQTEFAVGEKNIKYEPLVKSEKVFLPPLHIKLDLTKQFVKALDKKGDCFKYLCVKFSAITEENLKAGVFDGPQIRGLLNDPVFISTTHLAERDEWNVFAAVVTNILGNTKAENYRLLVGNLLQVFQMLGAIWVWNYTSCIAMWIIFLTIQV